MGEQFEVRKYGHTVPLAEGPCFNCGRPVRFNLAAGIADHVDDGQPNDCRDPWPGANIERVEIYGAALGVADVAASTNEASGDADGNRGARVDGSGVDVTLPPEPPPLSVALVRIPGGHPGGIVFRHYGPRSIGGAGWRVPNVDAATYTWAQLHKLGEVTPLVEHTPAFERGIRADELRGAARDLLDRHYELSRVTVATFADWLRQRAGIVAGQPTEGAAGEVTRG